jgi:hypothetical protein
MSQPGKVGLDLQTSGEITAALKTDIGEVSGSLRDEGLSGIEALRLSIAQSLIKKWLPTGSDEQCDRAALEKFKSVNARVSAYSPPRNNDLLFRWKGTLERLLDPIPELGPSQIGHFLGVGPGSSRKVDSRCLFTKLRDRPSCSNRYLIDFYKRSLAASGGMALNYEVSHPREPVMTPESRLFFVPKTSAISRTCCTEPLVNMMIQKAISHWFEFSLSCVGINLSTQAELNKNLARIGSKERSFGTADLTSASDSTSWALIQWAFNSRRDILGLLSASRCDRAVLPDGETIELGMISTMGNGFTFSLETLIFVSAVLTVYEKRKLNFSNRSKPYGVFGDDIVVKTEMFDEVVSLLELLGYEVNGDKSFNSGPFRESCGGDYYNGLDVRGVYLRSCSTPQDSFSAYNRVVAWSALHDVPLFNLIGLLSQGIDKRVIIPYNEDDAAGRKVSYREAADQTRRVGPYRQIAYRRLVYRANTQTIARLDPDNSHSELIALCGLHGSIRSPSVPVGTRQFLPEASFSSKVSPGRWRWGTGLTPYWDYAPDCSYEQFQRWKALVDLLAYC